MPLTPFAKLGSALAYPTNFLESHDLANFAGINRHSRAFINPHFWKQRFLGNRNSPRHLAEFFQQSISHATQQRISDDKKSLLIENDFFTTAYNMPLPFPLGEGIKEIFCKELTKIRKKVIHDLANTHETSLIYATANKEMRALITHMIDTYISISGPPPCHYNILILGSFSGYEATPWSDLEMTILCQENTPLPCDYFIKLSQWLAFTFLALGETPINGKGRIGTRLDITKNPLGPQGRGIHICSPSTMALWQSKAHHQHEPGYHLSGALLFADSLCGDPEIYHQYNEAMLTIISKPSWYSDNLTRYEEFAKYLSLRFSENIFLSKHHNIKQIYRDFQLLLSSLSLLFGYTEKGLREQVHVLNKNNLWPDTFGKSLSHTIDFILRLRLQTYAYYQQQIHEVPVIYESDHLPQLRHAYTVLNQLWEFVKTRHAMVTAKTMPIQILADVTPVLPFVIAHLPFDSRSGDTLAKHVSLLPCALTVLENGALLPLKPFENLIDGFTRIAHKYMQIDQYSSAQRALLKANTLLELCKTPISKKLLATLFRYQGRLDFLTQSCLSRSLNHLQESIKLWGILLADSLESDYPSILVQIHIAQCDLGKLLIDMGQLENAKTIFTDILIKANRFQQYNCYAYLGRIAFLQKKFSQSEHYLGRAIDILDELNRVQKSYGEKPLRNIDAYIYFAELALVQNRYDQMMHHLRKVKEIYYQSIKEHNPYAVQSNIQRWFLLAQGMKKTEAQSAIQHSRAMARIVYSLFPTHKNLQNLETINNQLEKSLEINTLSL